MTELQTIDRVVRHEGFRSHVYLDLRGYLSIGYGHTVGRVLVSVIGVGLTDDVVGRLAFQDHGRGITEPQARQLLISDLNSIEVRLLSDPALRFINHLTAARVSVLVEMSYQLGHRGLLGFKHMRRALEQADYEGAAKEMLDSKWARQAPKRAQVLAELMAA